MSHLHVIRRSLPLLILGACLGSTTPAVIPRPAVLHESLCWLLADPDAYNGRVVEVRAGIRSDGIEHVQLVDDECSGMALPVETSAPYSSDPRISEVITRAYQRAMRSSPQPISATFTGIVRHQPGSIPAVVFHLTSVTDVEADRDSAN